MMPVQDIGSVHIDREAPENASKDFGSNPRE